MFQITNNKVVTKPCLISARDNERLLTLTNRIHIDFRRVLLYYQLLVMRNERQYSPLDSINYHWLARYNLVKQEYAITPPPPPIAELVERLLSEQEVVRPNRTILKV